MLKSNLKIFTVFLLSVPSMLAAQSLKMGTQTLGFGTHMKFQTDSLVLVLENTGKKTIHIDDLNLYNGDFFLQKDSAFAIAPESSDSFHVFFRPRHNIEYNTELVIVTREEGAYRVDLLGTGQYPGTYYSATFNKSEQDLKDQLKITLANGYVSLGYNVARDWMYMTIDNQRFNGMGASVNTIECVYTGRKVVNYISRSTAQTDGNLNTEHTYPQSKFNSVEPAMSDMFHLFIADGPANSVRSNHPFSLVASPTWQNGGSKYASSMFEPRDAHKGNAARAMLYFVVRYQNSANFLTSQESLLRTWALTYPPNRIDSLRNEKIFTLQKNRNPFIDHPEFLERITSVSNTSVAPSVRTYSVNLPVSQGTAPAVLFYGESKDTVFYQLTFTATGNQDVTLNYSLAQVKDVILSASSSLIPAGESAVLQMKVLRNSKTSEKDTLLVSSPSGNLRIPLMIDITALSVKGVDQEPVWYVYPNPAQGKFCVRLGEEGSYELSVFDVSGKKVHSTVINNTLNEINVPHLSPGYYFVRLKGSNRQWPYTLLLR